MNSGYTASLAFYPFRSLIINPGPAGFPVHRRHSFCMSGFRSFAAPATKQLPLSAFHSSAIMGIQANQIRPTLSHTAQHQLASLKNESVKVGGEKWAGTVKKQLSEPRHGGPSLQGVSAMRWEGLREHRPGKRTWERKRCGGGEQATIGTLESNHILCTLQCGNQLSPWAGPPGLQKNPPHRPPLPQRMCCHCGARPSCRLRGWPGDKAGIRICMRSLSHS